VRNEFREESIEERNDLVMGIAVLEEKWCRGRRELATRTINQGNPSGRYLIRKGLLGLPPKKEKNPP